MAPLSKKHHVSRSIVFRHTRRLRLRHTLLSAISSPCDLCKTRSYFSFLHQHRRLRSMAITRSMKLTEKVWIREASIVPPEAALVPQQPPKEPPRKVAPPVNSPVGGAVAPEKYGVKLSAPLAASTKLSDPPAKSLGNKSGPKSALPKSPVNGARISKAWPSRVGRPKTRGLINPYNLCYRRSLQQALLSAPQLFNLLEGSRQQCNLAGRCVTCALRQLFRVYHGTSGTLPGAVRSLDQVIKDTGRRSEPKWTARETSQEDSHEFLQYLLGTVEKAPCIQ